MTSVILFIDTNGFIQLRDLKDLNWRELFPGVKHLRIVVARPVIQELDDFKTSTNQRRRDRARSALKLIDEASKAAGRSLTLKEKPVRVTLEIAPRSKVDWSALAELDPASPDDRLVAAAATFGNGAAILSHDSGPRISARDIGLMAYQPPPDWHLQPEQSDHERKIARLERELKQARDTKPQLQIELHGRDESGKLKLIRPKLPAFDSATVDRLTRRYLRQHPRASLKAVPAMVSVALGYGVTEDQVVSYNREYDAFEERVRDYFKELHKTAPAYLIVPSVGVTITNTGSVSAMDYHVTLRSSGDFNLVADLEDIRKMHRPPQPPEEPATFKGYDILHHGLLSPHMPKERDPTELRWLKRPKLGENFGRYGCKDFRPKRKDESEVGLWQNEELPAVGELEITAGANDTADISESVEVTLEERETNWDDPRIVEALPESIKNVLTD